MGFLADMGVDIRVIKSVIREVVGFFALFWTSIKDPGEFPSWREKPVWIFLAPLIVS